MVTVGVEGGTFLETCCMEDKKGGCVAVLLIGVMLGAFCGVYWYGRVRFGK